MSGGILSTWWRYDECVYRVTQSPCAYLKVGPAGFPSVFVMCKHPYRDNQCQFRQRAYYSTDSWYCVQYIISDCWSCAWSSECVYQKWSKEKKIFWSHLSLSPSSPPPATYEEVSVAGEKSHDIQLTSNESYAHIQSQQRNIPSSQKNIETSLNTAYGVVS